MPELTAAIVGLGTTGTSLGLALKQARTEFHVLGHDRDRGRLAVASKLGAVDKTHWNLHRTVEPADLTVLAVPGSELPDLLPLLDETWKPRSLIVILTSAMQPVLALAEEHLPEQVAWVLANPVLTGINAPVREREDLFKDVLFCLVPGRDTAPETMQVAHNLIEHLGAKPHYVDALEHDGLVAGVEHTAHLLAAAYMHAAASGAGWSDARKLAGRAFHQATDSTLSPQHLQATLLANREYVSTWLTIMQRELAEWQQLLTGDGDELLARLEDQDEARVRWLKGASLQDWSEDRAPVVETSAGGVMRQMFLGRLGSRRRLPQDDGTDRER